LSHEIGGIIGWWALYREIKDMSTLVFGGAGFIGSYLVRRLTDEGEDVVIVDQEVPDPPMPALLDITRKFGFEICHAEYSSQVVNIVSKYRPEYIFNLVPSYSPLYELNPSRGVRINLDTHINILEASKTFGVKRILFASSRLVYGAGRTDVENEESLPRPELLYSACKVMNEYLGTHYNKHFGVDCVTLRFSSSFGWGRGQRKLESRGPWAVELFENPLQGLPVVLERPYETNSLMYVKDLVAAAILVMRAPTLKYRVYDIASEPRSKAEAAKIIRKLIPEAKIEFQGEQLPEGQALNVQRPWQGTRLETEFGYKPAFTFEESIRDYISMARSGMFRW
jgi:nucleoside-diphosphate-sugar epimerase